jgi:hypothetical protein
MLNNKTVLKMLCKLFELGDTLKQYTMCVWYSERLYLILMLGHSFKQILINAPKILLHSNEVRSASLIYTKIIFLPAFFNEILNPLLHMKYFLKIQ